MTTKKRTAGILSAFLALGVLLGAGGSTLALWSDTAHGDGKVGSGFDYFAVGRVGDTQPARDHRVSVGIGPAEAETLLARGEVAVALQTDSVSQGNKGLRYTLTPPAWKDGIFAASNVTVFRVLTPEECTVAKAPERQGELRSTPVSADYSDSEEPVAEYWCLTATLKNDGEVGTYTNTASVSADDPSGTTVKADDSWSATVGLGLDPKKEPTHEIVFGYETFRPGGVSP